MLIKLHAMDGSLIWVRASAISGIASEPGAFGYTDEGGCGLLIGGTKIVVQESSNQVLELLKDGD